MNEVTLPPSPNWYRDTILACAKDGTVAWGASNSIVVARSTPDKKNLEYSIIKDAHKGRINTLVFSPNYGNPDQNLLATGGDDHVVRVWNLDTETAIMAHSYLDDRQIIIGVDWSIVDMNLICCISTDGPLITWNAVLNVSHELSLGKLAATCLSCSKHDANLVAIGLKNGLVYIVNVRGSGKIIYKLRGHDTEITSLSWCPVSENILSNTKAKDLLLASGAKDRLIFIWRAGGDGRYESQLRLPMVPLDSRSHRNKSNTTTGNWMSVCWVSRKILLVTSAWGELLSFDVSSSTKPKPVLIHELHNRSLFCISNVPKDVESEDQNWRSDAERNEIVWTLAQDRQVICCQIKGVDSEILYQVPGQGGFVYSIAASPLDTSRIAYGVGDGMLRLWNLSEPHEKTFDVTTLWQNIKGKVLTIAWHPEKENYLAFGTVDGRVGIFDTNSTSKPPVLYRQYHRHGVYSLGWGPRPEQDGKNLALYSCAGGELVYFNPEKPNDAPERLVKKECTEFSWKPDHSLMAVGYESGLITFFNRELKPCGQSIYSLKKDVQSIEWHPLSTSTDTDLSPLRNQFAVGTNALTVTIFDVTDLVSKLEVHKDLDGADSPVSSDTDAAKLEATSGAVIIGTLNGHASRVVDLSWSPHISGYLATASFDRTVRIWRTETQQLVCTYTGHDGPVYSCMWSPLDPDLVLSGSADFTLRIWRVSEQRSTEPFEIAENNKPRRIRTKKKKTAAIEAPDTCLPDNESKTASVEVIDTNGVAHDETVEFSMTEREIRGIAAHVSKKKKPKNPVYFPVTTKILNDKATLLDSVKQLVEDARGTRTTEVEGDEETRAPEKSVPSLFRSKQDILEILRVEKSAHVKSAQYQTATELDLWSNNLKENLRDAAKEKRLNDFLVSLAPSLSVRFWQEMCEMYAAQLELEGNHRKAVSYLLSVHKINEAIRVFTEANMYKEAYVLAKCKLDEDDPIVGNLLETWAKSAAEDGNYETVVECYVKLGKYDQAAKYLSRRKDVGSLEMAAELALLSGDEEFCATLAQRAVNEALSAFDYATAKNIVKTYPRISFCELRIAAMKEIQYSREKCDDDYVWNWLEAGTDYGILRCLADQFPNPEQYYNGLSRSVGIAHPDAEQTLWHNVADQLALAIASNEDQVKCAHLTTAANMIYESEAPMARDESQRSGLQHFLIKFLARLDGTKPFSDNHIFSNKETTANTSLRAYLCQGIFHWLSRFDAAELETTGRLELVRVLMKTMLEDLLNARTFRYKMMSSKIVKLETELADAIGKSPKAENNANETVETLMERLNEYRAERDKFLTERIAAPCPIWGFENVCESTRSLFPDEAGKEMLQYVSDVWTSAISLP